MSLVVFFGNPNDISREKKKHPIILGLKIPEFTEGCYFSILMDHVSSYEVSNIMNPSSGLGCFYWDHREPNLWVTNCCMTLPTVQNYLNIKERIFYCDSSIRFDKIIRQKDILERTKEHYFNNIDFTIVNCNPNLILKLKLILDKNSWFFEGPIDILLWKDSLEIKIPPEYEVFKKNLLDEIKLLIKDLYILSPYYYINYFPNVLKDHE